VARRGDSAGSEPAEITERYAAGRPVASINAERLDRAMVQLAKRGPTMVYVLLEGDRPIGRVVAPAGEPVLGAGAGTVLLRRETERVAAAAA